MNTLIHFFVARPVVANLIMVFVFLLAVITAGDVSFEYNPKVDMGVINITTVRAGAGPEEIELSITLPIEEELLKVDGIKKVFSQSMENVSIITLRLDHGARPKTEVMADIQKAVDRANSRLPTDLVEKPQVEELSTLVTPIAEVHVGGKVPEEILREVSRKLADGLREVPGVASVEKKGYRRREVHILLEPARLSRLNIGVEEIIQAIQSRNMRNTGGSLESFLAEKKVVTVGQFQHPRQVEEVVLRSAEPGNAVLLRDVATVVMDYDDWEIQSRSAATTSIVLQLRKKANADELSTSDAIHEFARLQQLPAGVEIEVVNDISRLTRHILGILVDNAILGFVLVLVALCYFLNPRLALWVALGLPFSVALTFLLMPVFGQTANTMSLLAMILMLGILVDDAIVVGESVQRLEEMGLAPAQAAITGTGQVAHPVIASAMTTMLAFLPLLFMSGPSSAFLYSFPVVIIIILTASLFECLCILPAHLAHAGVKLRVTRADILTRWRERYRLTVEKLLRRRYLTLCGFLVFYTCVMIFGANTIKFLMFSNLDIDTIKVKVELPVGSSFEQTTLAVDALEADLREQVPADDLLNISSEIGHHDTDFYGAVEGRSDAWALINIYLKPLGQRQVETHELVAHLRQQIQGREGFKNLVVESQTDLPVGGKAVEVEFIGDTNVAHALAAELSTHLHNHAAITETWTSYTQGKDLLDLHFNYPLLAARNLTVAEVTRAVRVAMDGLLVDELQTVDERIRYRLRFSPQMSGKLETLENLTIINSEGDAIYLKSVADFGVTPGEASIKHYLGQRTVTVFAEIDRSQIDVPTINRDIAAYISEQGWGRSHPQIRIWQGGEAEEQTEAMGNMGQALVICVVSILFLLVLLFNSLSQPLIILLCIPFSLTGVVLGFGLQGLSMDLTAMTGVVGLIGLLVNDSLVSVHRLNHKRAELPSGEFLNVVDVAQACTLRFRPILITTITTVVGLLPTAYGLAGANPYVTPMVMVMCWGVGFGGLVSLVLLPVLYMIEQDIRNRLRSH
ncbi:MAG: efflux RND transporter permease subunit [Halieaceae bacterium]|jgi:multidrug efflux pump subunit AcrB|nr:efflux RND transporter permease subunit [Halieaceae bacterium]